MVIIEELAVVTTGYCFFGFEPLLLLTIWRLGSTLTIQLDSIPSTSTAKRFCRTVLSSKALVTTNTTSFSAFSFRIGCFLVLQLNWSHVKLLHVALSLSTFCLITMSFVVTTSNGQLAHHLCGFLICAFGISYATSETDWLASTFSASVVLLITVCSR